MPSLIFRKGLDMKEAVAAELAAAYHSHDRRRGPRGGFVRQHGRLTIHLARNSASATASIAPSTTPIRRASDFPTGASS